MPIASGIRAGFYAGDLPVPRHFSGTYPTLR